MEHKDRAEMYDAILDDIEELRDGRSLNSLSESDLVKWDALHRELTNLRRLAVDK